LLGTSVLKSALHTAVLDILELYVFNAFSHVSPMINTEESSLFPPHWHVELPGSADAGYHVFHAGLLFSIRNGKPYMLSSDFIPMQVASSILSYCCTPHVLQHNSPIFLVPTTPTTEGTTD
jgi:hypothetical protein